MLIHRNIRAYERGVLFHNGAPVQALGPGDHWRVNVLRRKRIAVFDAREVLLQHADLEQIARSGLLAAETIALSLQHHERALVWVDGRFHQILPPGVHVLWKTYHDVQIERADVGQAAFAHAKLDAILAWPQAGRFLAVHEVAQEHKGLLFLDGVLERLLEPGRHLFWKTARRLRVETIGLREEMLDVAGQEIMTADRVTLRLNMIVTFKVTDPVRAVSAVTDYKQTLYREAQLALRAVVGGRELDALLADKNAVAGELEAGVRQRAEAIGLRLVSLGIRDVILPGEMKELLNKVTEARKAAEANLITRREETASMRMQANTAKILEGNPVLMRLRELEVLEKVADKSKLNVVLGEKGLAERVVNLI